MVVTDLLSQNVPVKDVQYLVGHSASSSTQVYVYDRRARRVTRNIVERISVCTMGRRFRLGSETEGNR